MKFNKLGDDEKSQIRRAILLMRYRTEAPTGRSRKHCPYKTIAKVIGMPYGTVQHVCRKSLHKAKRPTVK